METEGTVPPRPVLSKAMFQGPADAYDSFMGRYSRALAPAFGDFCLPSVGRFLCWLRPRGIDRRSR
ncbi:hypothetical protein SAMN02745244_02537 [Tessaracoccus bendigoensis DSM 12906]|uniref:Uncharacterized protein n=1 Tax=Tessaracoccus bendigoensis DSM 12906 TaxID=1123357 RepID=A0A1M6JDP3_9ACTN|nr:hypothetical protein SAMN02745244_02537 [Tessaracoccus bendigoensis DSM 12906]